MIVIGCMNYGHHLTYGYVILILVLPYSTKKKQTFLSAMLKIALLFFDTARRLFFFMKKSMIMFRPSEGMWFDWAPLCLPEESRYWQTRASLKTKFAFLN